MAGAIHNAPWTAEEVKLLRELWTTHTAEEIAARLGRSDKAVLTKAGKLGLRDDPGVPPLRTWAEVALVWNERNPTRPISWATAKAVGCKAMAKLRAAMEDEEREWFGNVG